mgnify:CR=1 FL=1
MIDLVTDAAIDAANGPNLASARARSFDWLSTAATRPAGCPAARKSLTTRTTSAVDSYRGSASSSRSPSTDRICSTSSRSMAPRYRGSGLPVIERVEIWPCR